MKVFLLGLSHKTAPIELREKVAFPEDTLEALKKVTGAPAVDEAMIVSTCNRVELVGVGPNTEDGVAALRSFLSSFHGITAMELDPHLYSHTGPEAVRHLFRVASSLDSMVIGEPQITGQVKDAYAAAQGAGTVGSTLHKVMHRTFMVAKRVRTETAIAQNAVSISYAAVELARKIFGDLNGRAAMLVGAGKMGELAATHLRAQGITEVMVANRTYERAVAMAKAFNGTPVPLEKLRRYLELADIVIFAAGGGHLLNRPTAQEVIKARKYRPMFLIDIAVPRLVASDVNEVENIYLYDIDDLRGVVEENLAERMSEAKRGEAIVAAEIESFTAAFSQLNLAPTIADFNRKLSDISAIEFQRSKGLKDLTEEQRDAVERMVKGLLKKIAHDPIKTLQDEHRQGNGFLYVETLRRLFNLPEESSEDDE